MNIFRFFKASTKANTDFEAVTPAETLSDPMILTMTGSTTDITTGITTGSRAGFGTGNGIVSRTGIATDRTTGSMTGSRTGTMTDNTTGSRVGFGTGNGIVSRTGIATGSRAGFGTGNGIASRTGIATGIATDTMTDNRTDIATDSRTGGRPGFGRAMALGVAVGLTLIAGVGMTSCSGSGSGGDTEPDYSFKVFTKTGAVAKSISMKATADETTLTVMAGSAWKATIVTTGTAKATTSTTKTATDKTSDKAGATSTPTITSEKTDKTTTDQTTDKTAPTSTPTITTDKTTSTSTPTITSEKTSEKTSDKTTDKTTSTSTPTITSDQTSDQTSATSTPTITTDNTTPTSTPTITSEKTSEKTTITSDKTATTGWVTCDPAAAEAGPRQVTITAQANDGTEARTATLTFTIQNKEVATITITQAGKEDIPEPTPGLPKADLLDAAFYNNGTAADLSASKMTIEQVPGTGMVNYMNTAYGRYAAHFNHTQGDVASDGFYKVDYSTRQDFIDKLADGHSMEVLFKTDIKSDGTKEIKMLSSMNAGGTGFLISKTANGGCLTFLPNVSTNGTSSWKWAKSGINPEAGRYYHAVGVWNKERGKAEIYVDGMLKASVSAEGDLVMPATKASCWFGIGVDPATTTGESAWKGDVVLARIYDKPLTSDEVAMLYDDVKANMPAKTDMHIDGINYMSGCDIAAGYKYYVYGLGFRSGDKVRIESLVNPSDKTTCETEIKESQNASSMNPSPAEGYAKVTIPAGFTSGTYRMMLVRGDNEYPLGSTTLALSGTPSTIGGTKVIAHRGYHKEGATENSMAALKKAQALGVYGAEFDVWICADDTLFVNHNATFAANTSLRIENSTYDQLKDLQLANGERVPRLSEYLDQIAKDPNMKGILEIKSHTSRTDNNRAVDACVEAVRKRGLETRIEFIAFDYENCKRIHAALPTTPVQYLGGNVAPSKIKADGLSGIDYSMANLTNDYITEAHKLGLIVNVWTVNSAADMAKYVGLGVDYITTDNPEVLKDLVSKTYVSKD